MKALHSTASRTESSRSDRDAFWRRLQNLVPLFLALLAYGIAAVLLFRNMHHFDGDEPHYVLMADSLCRDGDADLRNNYEADDYLSFYPRSSLAPHAYDYRNDGALRSVHSIGLPILLILPHCILGHPYWARLEMAALAALASWSIFLTIRNWTKRPHLAHVVWAAVTFTTPMWPLAPQLYPDVAAVLGVSVALQIFLSRPLTAGKALGIGFVVAALPWLHNRFAVLSLLIAATTVISLLRARLGWKTFVCLLLPPIISGLLSMWNSYVWYGGILPSASYGLWSQHFRQFSLDRLYVALADLLLGREFGLVTYAPIYLLALIGCVLMLVHRKTDFAAPLIWLLGYFLAVALSQAMYQIGWGYYFPARLLLPVVPVLAIPLAYAIQNTRWLRMVGLALFLISVAISLQSLLQPYKALADQNGVSELPQLKRIQGIYPALQYIQQDTQLDLSRTYRHTGQLTHDQITDSQIILADPQIDEPGFMAFGPYLAFQTGQYAATITLGRGEAEPSAVVAHIDVVTDEGNPTLAGRDIYAYEFSTDSEPHGFSLSFSTRDTWPIETRVYFTGESTLWLQSITIRPQTEIRSPSYPGLPIVVGWGLLVIITGLLAARRNRCRGMEPACDDQDIQ